MLSFSLCALPLGPQKQGTHKLDFLLGSNIVLIYYQSFYINDQLVDQYIYEMYLHFTVELTLSGIIMYATYSKQNPKYYFLSGVMVICLSIFIKLFFEYQEGLFTAMAVVKIHPVLDLSTMLSFMP